MSKPRLTTGFLVAYSFAVTIAFFTTSCFVVLHSVHAADRTVEFDRIRVHRIDVVEPDGTPRLILSDRAEYPGSFFHGHEVPRPDRRDSAGMLFINDEGTEDGGLIYGGLAQAGTKSSFSHLSFDQYDQDQTLVLGTALSEDGTRTEGITLNDAPDQPITPALYAEADRIKAMPHGEQREKAWAEFLKHFPSLKQRASLQRSADGSVGLALRDSAGRVRLQLSVRSDGQPQIDMFDAAGQVQRSISLSSATH
jgi:hypothetical protein